MRIKKIFWVLLVAISSINLLRSVLETRASLGRLNRLQEEVSKLAVSADSLKKEVAYKESTEFLEREARDKLGLVKSGEVLVVLPDSDSVLVDNVPTPPKVDKTPNWKKWKKFLLE